ncbi:hypothetical protein [Agromyces humi]|uniref:hypothetical protein n=1 Tax=Agromyces humi TaxID=1766800 RepID=UPI0013574BED|nr:hypothetical protein [Agromyces humi]
MTDTLALPAPTTTDYPNTALFDETRLFDFQNEAPEPADLPAPTKAPKQVRRFKQMDTDRMWYVVSCLVIVVLVLAASILWSFNAIVAMSGWMAPNNELRWLPAVFLDMAIIGYTAINAALRARTVVNQKAVRLVRVGLIVSTMFSVIANGTHTLDFWNDNLTTYQAIIGVAFSSAIPLLALLATEVLILFAFVDPDGDDEAARLRKEMKEARRANRRFGLTTATTGNARFFEGVK